MKEVIIVMMAGLMMMTTSFSQNEGAYE